MSEQEIVSSYNPWYFTKIILPYFMKWLKVVIDDKNRMEPIIMNSQLELDYCSLSQYCRQTC